jgi:uncharacterized protein with ParB-like and HNH nuclease domain
MGNSSLLTIISIFDRSLFRIPDYQRGYSWEEKQLSEFWNDLMLLPDGKTHYTGQLTLKQIENYEKDHRDYENDSWLFRNGYKLYHVVDGQQRLTTVLIMLFVLLIVNRNLSVNKDKKDSEIMMNDFESLDVAWKRFISITSGNEIQKSFIFGYEKDDPSEKYLINTIFQSNNISQENTSIYTKNLLYAKSFFTQHIEDLIVQDGEESIKNLYNIITTRLMFNMFYIEKDFDVNVAFETMNNRGKRLSNLEILKNRLIYIISLYEEKIIDKDAQTVLRNKINKAWKEIYVQLGQHEDKNRLLDDDFLRDHWITYFGYTRKTGDDYINFLLRIFNADQVIKNNKIIRDSTNASDETLDDNDIIEDDSIAEFIDDNILRPKEVDRFVTDIQNKVFYWFATFAPFNEAVVKKYNNSEITSLLDKLARLGYSYFRPLVMIALSKYNFTKAEQEHIINLKILELLKTIERYVFFMFAIGENKANSFNSIYYNYSKDLRISKKPVEMIDSIVESLNNTINDYSSENKRRFIEKMSKRFVGDKLEGYYHWYYLKYILYEYEISLAGLKEPKILWKNIILKDKEIISIEHILPQTPSQWYWENQFRKYYKDTEKMLSLTNSLGNLLLLSQAINSSLSNDSFPDKCGIRSETDRGYKDGDYSEREVARYNDWNPQSIYERTIKILKFMNKRWHLGYSSDEIRKLSGIDFISIDTTETPAEFDEPIFDRLINSLKPIFPRKDGWEIIYLKNGDTPYLQFAKTGTISWIYNGKKTSSIHFEVLLNTKTAKWIDVFEKFNEIDLETVLHVESSCPNELKKILKGYCADSRTKLHFNLNESSIEFIFSKVRELLVDMKNKYTKIIDKEVEKFDQDNSDIQHEKRNFNFLEMGIPSNSKLKLISNPKIECVTDIYKHVYYGDNKYSLTKLTKEVTKKEYISGALKYWSYNGRALNEIFEERYRIEYR